jgi:hypothetical protein
MRRPKQPHGLHLESLESRTVLQGVGFGNPFDGVPQPPFETPPVDAPPIDVPPAPPTAGRPVIVHPLGGPGRPEVTPPNPVVPPFGEPAPAALNVAVPPAPPEVIPPVDLPDQVPDDVPPAPPTNGRPVIVHPLGGPGRPEVTPPNPVVPPFGEPAPAAVVMRAARIATSEGASSARTERVRAVAELRAVDVAHTQSDDTSALSASRATTVRRSQSR